MKISIGEKVSLQVPLPYLKTADSISILRPPDLVSLDEVGVIIGIRSNDLLEVKFRRGNFLIPSERLKFLKEYDWLLNKTKLLFPFFIYFFDNFFVATNA